MAEPTFSQEINAQWFPLFIAAPRPVPFTLNGVASGAVGAQATISFALNNFPMLFYGVRISMVYPLPTVQTAINMALYENLKRFTDGECTLRITMAQQNIQSDLPLLTHVQGESSGIHWHSFPNPYPLAGANNVLLELQRMTAYPVTWIGTDPAEPILPQVHATLVTSQARNDQRTFSPHRVTGQGFVAP